MIKGLIAYFLCFLYVTLSWVNPIVATKGILQNELLFYNDFISQASPPSIDKIIPSEGFPGSELIITITGKGFASKSLVYFVPNTGMTLLSTTFITTGELKISIRISIDAPLGSRDVMVFNPDQQSITLKGGFTIKTAQPSPGSIKLTPEKAENPVYTDHKVVASVLDTTGKPLPGVKILFTVTGIHTVEGSVLTDTNGQAFFVYQGNKPGTDTIIAMVPLGGMLPAFLTATAYKTWYLKPPEPGSIKLTPEKAENPVGTNHKVIATVLDTTNKPMSGIKVLFTITGSNPTSGTAITDTNGQAVFTYIGAKAGEDKITASVDKLTATSSKHWYIKVAPPPTVTANKPIEGEQGQTLELTITGKDFVSGAILSFSPPTGINIVSVKFVSSTELKVRITIVKDTTSGTRDIVVTNPDKQSSILKGGFTVKPEMVKPVPLLPGSVKLTPEKAENPVGTNHKVIAAILDTTNKPMSGIKVLFTITGSNPTSSTVITDTNGQAVFTYTGAKAGEDKITATVDKLTASALKYWYTEEVKLQIISGPTVSEITQNSAAITWTTSRESDSKVRYDTYSSKFRYSVEDAQLVKEHRLVLSELEPGKIYQFMVESKDPTGNFTSSQPRMKSLYLSLETQSLLDEEQPTITLVIPEKLSGKRVTIKAITRDKVGVDRVVFFLNGKYIFTDFTLPFEWQCDTSGLNEGGHYFSAQAFDVMGNMGEAIREGTVKHLFSAALSPVRVRILSPARGSNVYGRVTISAEINHDHGLGISRLEFLIDENIIKEENFDPPYYFVPTLSPTFVVNCPWDTSGMSPGTHVINVRVRDEIGNWGLASIRVRVADPPTPSISVTREVRRISNYFEVTLRIQNTSVVDISGLTISDTNTGFQCIENAFWQRDEESWQPLICTVVNGRVRYYWRCTLQASLYILNRGETKALRYYAIPMLCDPILVPSLTPTIGSDLRISFRAGDREYTQRPSLGWSNTEEQNAAFNAADYLIVTSPYQLFSYNPGDDGAVEVSKLLSAMADLAREKSGVLGFLSSARSAEGFKRLIISRGVWSQKLSPDWDRNGYLLIVGENNIVPTFDIAGFNRRARTVGGETMIIDVVNLTDFPYSDTYGNDNLPELKVGRIIGKKISTLIKPIRASIEVVGFGSFGVTTSGEASHGEPFVRVANETAGYLRDKGMRVDTLHWNELELRFFEDFNRLAPNLNILALFGHGHTSSCNPIQGGHVSRLNFSSHPVVVAFSCLTGYYGHDSIEELAAIFFRRGAGVYIGSTEVTPGRHTNIFPGLFLRDQFSLDKTIAEALTEFKQGRMRTGDGWWRFMCFAYNLYGDPKFGQR